MSKFLKSLFGTLIYVSVVSTAIIVLSDDKSIATIETAFYASFLIPFVPVIAGIITQSEKCGLLHRCFFDAIGDHQNPGTATQIAISLIAAAAITAGLIAAPAITALFIAVSMGTVVNTIAVIGIAFFT